MATIVKKGEIKTSVDGIKYILISKQYQFCDEIWEHIKDYMGFQIIPANFQQRINLMMTSKQNQKYVPNLLKKIKTFFKYSSFQFIQHLDPDEISLYDNYKYCLEWFKKKTKTKIECVERFQVYRAELWKRILGIINSPVDFLDFKNFGLQVGKKMWVFIDLCFEYSPTNKDFVIPEEDRRFNTSNLKNEFRPSQKLELRDCNYCIPVIITSITKGKVKMDYYGVDLIGRDGIDWTREIRTYQANWANKRGSFSLMWSDDIERKLNYCGFGNKFMTDDTVKQQHNLLPYDMR